MTTSPPVTNTILGGTGRFAGATGSVTGSAVGFITFADMDPEADQVFGAISVMFTGVINLPDGDDGGTEADCNDDGVVNGADIVGAGCDD